MAIAFRAESGGGANAAVITVTIPASVQAGDGMLAAWAFNNSMTPTLPSGWTQVGTQQNRNSLASILLKRVAQAGDASSTVDFTNSGINRQTISLVAWSGTDGTDFVDAFASRLEDTSGTSHATPTATTVAADCVAVGIITERNSTTTTDWTPPTGYTERSDRNTAGSGGTSVSIADNLTPVAASTSIGGGSFTGGAAAHIVVVTWTVSMKPASSGDQTVTLNGIATTGAVGAPTVTPGAVTVTLTGVASGEALGQPTVSPGPVTVSLTAIASAEAVGQPAVQPGPVTVTLTGVPTGEAVGQPAIQPGAVTVSLTGIASTAAVGQPTVSLSQTVELTGVASTAAVGSPTLTVAAVPSGRRGPVRRGARPLDTTRGTPSMRNWRRR